MKTKKQYITYAKLRTDLETCGGGIRRKPIAILGTSTARGPNGYTR